MMDIIKKYTIENEWGIFTITTNNIDYIKLDINNEFYWECNSREEIYNKYNEYLLKEKLEEKNTKIDFGGSKNDIIFVKKILKNILNKK